MSADFTPTIKPYTNQGAFRFWCQTVLPLVYDDSLSYYELLNKVVNYLNNVISDVSNMGENVTNLSTAYSHLQDYVNEKLVELETFMNEYFDSLDVQEEINKKLDEMATSGELNELIKPTILQEIPSVVSSWLEENITPTSPVIDKTLSVFGAGADAKVTGVKFDMVDETIRGSTVPTVNVFNSSQLLLAEGVTENDGVYSGTYYSFWNRFRKTGEGQPFTFVHEFDENTIYKIVLDFKMTNATPAETSGLGFCFNYTDGTERIRYLSNQTVDEWRSVEFRSDAGKTIKNISVTLNAGRDNVANFRNIMITKYLDVNEYTPYKVKIPEELAIELGEQIEAEIPATVRVNVDRTIKGTIQYETGIFTATNSWNCTDLLSCDGSKYDTLRYSRMCTIYSPRPRLGLAFYTDSLTYISGQMFIEGKPVAGYEWTKLEIPANARYFRFMCFSAESTIGLPYYELSNENKLGNRIKKIEKEQNYISPWMDGAFAINDDSSFMETSGSVYNAYRALGMTESVVGSDSGAEQDNVVYSYKYTCPLNTRINTFGVQSLTQAPTLILTSGIHGNERTAVNSLYRFVKWFLQDNEAKKYRESFNLIIIPVLNPVGFDLDTRYNGNNIDMNRNFEYKWWSNQDSYSGTGPLSDVLTQAINNYVLTAISENNVVALFDCHNFSGSGTGATRAYVATNDEMMKTIMSTMIRSTKETMLNAFSINSLNFRHWIEANNVPGLAAQAYEYYNIHGAVMETMITQETVNEGATWYGNYFKCFMDNLKY